MALRLLGILPAALQSQYRQALQVLSGLTTGEQLEIACQLVVGILVAARLRSEGSQMDRGDYNLLCDAVEAWIEDKVAALRLARTE